MKIIIKSVSILMLILIFLSTNVIAISQSDLNDVNKNIDKIKGDIKNVEEEKSSTMQEISKLNVKIYDLESQISEMQGGILAHTQLGLKFIDCDVVFNTQFLDPCKDDGLHNMTSQ